MWDTIKDYLNFLLGAVFLLVSIIFIPEIKKFRPLFVVIILVLVALGIDKYNRDNTKDGTNEQRMVTDSLKMYHMDSTITSVSNSYKQDTSRFSDFKRQLYSEFHIRDSANKPIQITNYTHINKATTVDIH